jgi:hypothetical protein
LRSVARLAYPLRSTACPCAASGHWRRRLVSAPVGAVSTSQRLARIRAATAIQASTDDHVSAHLVSRSVWAGVGAAAAARSARFANVSVFTLSLGLAYFACTCSIASANEAGEAGLGPDAHACIASSISQRLAKTLLSHNAGLPQNLQVTPLAPDETPSWLRPQEVQIPKPGLTNDAQPIALSSTLPTAMFYSRCL